MTDRPSTGGDTDTYCTKCRLDLEHIILAMVGGTVIKVQCKTCGSIHKFRGAPAARAKSLRRAGSGIQSLMRNQQLWEAAVGEAADKGIPYNMEGVYHAGEVIDHTTFGRGVVQRVLFKKCAVLFRDGERVLASANTSSEQQ